LRPPGVTWEP